MGFSENLNHLRTARNMTQEQLAMLMGVSRQAISKWESGRAYPEMDKLVRLCRVFECDLNELVNGDLTAIEVKPELVIPADAPATDVCDYDWRTRCRAWMLSAAAAVALVGMAGMVGTGGLPFYSSWSPVSSAPSLAFLLVALAIAVTLVVLGEREFRHFRLLYPSIQDFYSEQDREAARDLRGVAHRVALFAVALGGFFLVVQTKVYFHLGGGLTSFFFGLAVASWALLFARLMNARLDIERYNRLNAERLALRELRDEGALVRAASGERDEVLASARRLARRRRLLVCAAILGVGVALAAVMLALSWHIFWFALVGAAILAALVWMMYPYAR